MKHIAAVVLNYNSNNDLFKCIDLLKRQEGIILSIIIVDNCSNNNSKYELKEWAEKLKIKVVDKFEENMGKFKETSNTYLILNNENKGYSAGNNIGLKFATKIGVKASLIVNPDMIIEDKNYIKVLSNEMFLQEKCAVCSSRIKTLEGHDQNPLREITFFEELFWIRSVVKPISYVLSIKGNKSIKVPKVSGCCLLLNNDFLEKINYLDENVFLYCEEPILSAQVKKEGDHILYTPFTQAIHAHIRSEKGNSSERMLKMIKSRKYYLKKYTNNSKIKLKLLMFSYKLLELIHKYKRWRENGKNT